MTRTVQAMAQEAATMAEATQRLSTNIQVYPLDREYLGQAAELLTRAAALLALCESEGDF